LDRIALCRWSDEAIRCRGRALVWISLGMLGTDSLLQCQLPRAVLPEQCAFADVPPTDPHRPVPGLIRDQAAPTGPKRPPLPARRSGRSMTSTKRRSWPRRRFGDALARTVLVAHGPFRQSLGPAVREETVECERSRLIDTAQMLPADRYEGIVATWNHGAARKSSGLRFGPNERTGSPPFARSPPSGPLTSLAIAADSSASAALWG